MFVFCVRKEFGFANTQKKTVEAGKKAATATATQNNSYTASIKAERNKMQIANESPK